MADRRGAIAVQFACLLPLVVIIVGGALDYGQALNQRDHLQSAIDKAALAGARELGMADSRRENVPEVVKAMVLASMRANATPTEDPVIETIVRDDPMEVEVVAKLSTTPLFGSLGLGSVDLTLTAIARIVGRPNICVLGLDPTIAGAISLEREARVTGQGCAVFSNSTSAASIRAKNTANLTASMICAAGGTEGLRGNFAPEPLNDCPTFDDPLAGRPEPQIGSCDPNLPSKVIASRRLTPGTYCNGLEILSGAEVILDPGVYIIRDKPLVVRDGATLTGEGVALFLTGLRSELLFERGSTIDLSAPKSGPMSGILAFGARSQPYALTHRILSDNARNLLGTLYFPTTRLHVDANNPVADKSAYTAIIARMLTLYGGPHLVLNSNYDYTDVPVPHGIRGADQPISLVK